MLRPITTCLWFNTEAKEAADFYKSIFPSYEGLQENPMVVNYRIFGRSFMNLNGGTQFRINSSISFFLVLDNENELEDYWRQLSADGNVLMPFNVYPWSSRYGWCADRYGVNWQLMLQKDRLGIYPSLMFTGQMAGQAAKAIDFYTGLIPESEQVVKDPYKEGEGDVNGYLKYAYYLLNGLPFGAMDSSMPHGFAFNEAISFVLSVDTQEEIDLYWSRLTQEGSEGRCGWCKDQFGVSWQVVPASLGKIMSNPALQSRVMRALMPMKKIELASLQAAIQ